jgi:hypothetical protein
VATHTRKSGRLYRYYVSTAVLKHGKDACPIGRVPAGDIEAAVVDQLRSILRSPEIVARTFRMTGADDGDIAEGEVREVLQDLDPLWDELFPAEQARIFQLLVERVDLSESGLSIRLRAEGLSGLMRDLRKRDDDGSSAQTVGGAPHEHRGSRSANYHRPSAARHPETRAREARDCARRDDHSSSPANADGQRSRKSGRAYRWQHMLESDEYGSIAELAAAERINRSYVSRVLRLTLLAPEIVESVMAGCGREGITLEWALRAFPAGWANQVPLK